MKEYVAPIKDMLFNLRHVAGLEETLKYAAYADYDQETIDQVVEEAGKFANDILSPINVPGDQSGIVLNGGEVATAPGFSAAHQQFIESGWQSMDVSAEHGGMGLPASVGAAAMESWQSACMSYSLNPMLTNGAIYALEEHAPDEMRRTYLPRMATGEWTGTMNLTEPNAGSDLSVVTTRAIPNGDHYLISGTKIYITWGDHDMAENVIHLVLARLPDAPQGVRGISLFLVPKFLLDDAGKVAARNDVTVAGVEHKLGIHASPTCVMSFGENDGAIGYLVGEENKGLACMFSMMNHARTYVGIQGLAISERAYQLARNFALDRKQGSAPGVEGVATIIKHPDVRRMLLVMKSQTEAMRALAYYAAGVPDTAKHAESDALKAQAKRRNALLTPIVKTWMTEIAQEITSLGVQIHGGMGFVEETGAAQHMRDARILTIYEGTTGIQGLDFVGRKILMDEGLAMRELLEEMDSVATALEAYPEFSAMQSALSSGVDDLRSATNWLLENAAKHPAVAGAASVNLLMLAGVVVGGWRLAVAALALQDGVAADDADFAAAKKVTVQFYAEQIMPRAKAYAGAAMAPSATVMALSEEMF